VVSADQVVVTAGHPERVAELAREVGVRGAASNAEAARGASVVILSVKPQTVAGVLAELRGVLEPTQILVSVAASVSTAFIEKHLDAPVPVIRAMPNTPALIRAGMTALAPGRAATRDHLEAALHLFRPLGRTLRVDEKHMDAVTALSASGPAFIYIVIESLAEGGV
jgi:pyrroline-5-carboxylate reductase